MNYTVYIVNELSPGKFDVFPDDSSFNVIESAIGQSDTHSELFIHRDGDLMYYVYSKKLEENRRFGVALVINGVYFTSLTALADTFGRGIRTLAQNDKLIHTTNTGNLTAAGVLFQKEEVESKMAVEMLKSEVGKIPGVKKLPPVDFGISIASTKKFYGLDESNNGKVTECSVSYANVIVKKVNGKSDVESTSYQRHIRELNINVGKLEKEVASLRVENNKISRQKKQYKYVVLLFLALIGCGTGLFFYNSRLTKTEDQLHDARYVIAEKDKSLIEKNSSILELKDSVRKIRTDLILAERGREELQQTIDSIFTVMPIVVTGNKNYFNGFEFEYVCNYDKELTLTIRARNISKRKVRDFSFDLNFEKGWGTKILDYPSNLDSNDLYVVQLLYGDTLLTSEVW